MKKRGTICLVVLYIHICVNSCFEYKERDLNKNLGTILSAGDSEAIISGLLTLADKAFIDEQLLEDILVLSVSHRQQLQQINNGLWSKEEIDIYYRKLTLRLKDIIARLPEDIPLDIEENPSAAKVPARSNHKIGLMAFAALAIFAGVYLFIFHKKFVISLIAGNDQFAVTDSIRYSCDNCDLFGVIYERDAPLQGAVVRIDELDLESFTDASGKFHLATPADTHYVVDVIVKGEIVKSESMKPGKKLKRVSIPPAVMEYKPVNKFASNDIDCITERPSSVHVFDQLFIDPICCKYAGSSTLQCRLALEKKTIAPLKINLCHKVGNWTTLLKTRGGDILPASRIKLLGESVKQDCKEFELRASREELEITFEGVRRRPEIKIAEIKIATTGQDYILKDLDLN